MTPLFSHDYQVYINHTDAGGIVYHANHLSFYEHCRRDWFSKLGLNAYFFDASIATNMGSQTSLSPHHFVVTDAHVKYQQPILLDESITVTVDKVTVRSASLIFSQSIYRDKVQLSEARIVIACVQNQLLQNTLNPPSTNNNLHGQKQQTDEQLGHSKTPIDNPRMANPKISVRPVRLPTRIKQTIEAAINSSANSN